MFQVASGECVKSWLISTEVVTPDGMFVAIHTKKDTHSMHIKGTKAQHPTLSTLLLQIQFSAKWVHQVPSRVAVSTMTSHHPSKKEAHRRMGGRAADQW